MLYEQSPQYWEDYTRFLQIVEEITRKIYTGDHFFEMHNSPNKLVESWKETVDSGEGYSFTIFEWDDDTSVRGTIESVLRHDEIKKLEHFYNNFKSQIDKIDDRFMRITLDEYELPHRANWWERRILRSGQGEYKEHILMFYKIDLDTYQRK